MVSVVIVSNPHLANQIESAEWLRKGFSQHGIDAEVTADTNKGADVHVIQGPHYAYGEWCGKPNVLFLNRCFLGHPRWDVSIGWLNADGSRDFRWKDEPKGETPELKPMKQHRDCAVVFGDYGIDPTEMVLNTRNKYGRTYYHPHPAGKKESPALSPDWTLEQIWEIADVAVGGSSTVLVEAAIQGLHVEAYDPLHVVQGCEDDRQRWLNRLSWADWNATEIMAGTFWDHLCI